MESLTPDEREALLSDLASWKQELEMNDGMSDDKWDDFLDTIRGLSDTELVDWWESNVGEWVLSQSRVHRAYEDENGNTPDGDEILAEEREKLLDPSQETTYGYLRGRTTVSPN